MSGEVYSGPQFADRALVTPDEIESGEVKAPEGTEAYTVERGDNLYTIAARSGGYGNPPDMKAFYADNPQYAGRNPDLIYPGEVVFVRKPDGGTTEQQERANATDTSAQAVTDAHGLSASTDSQVTMKEDRIKQAEEKLATDVQAELEAGTSADEIIERLGGVNADPNVVRIVRQQATDHAAQKLLEAKASGDPQAIAQAQANLDYAVENEIEALAYSMAPEGNGSREDHGKGAIAAGQAIEQRLQELGLSEEAHRVGGIARQVEARINNEV